MTTMQIQSKNSMSLVWLALLALIACAYLAVASAKPVQVYTHAEAKHGQDAVAVRDCLYDKGAFAVYQKSDGRIIRLCEVEEGKFGLQVLEPDENGTLHEITAYIKNKMTHIEQVLNYLKNCGATQIWP